jgi:hypothetical protein
MIVRHSILYQEVSTQLHETSSPYYEKSFHFQRFVISCTLLKKPKADSEIGDCHSTDIDCLLSIPEDTLHIRTVSVQR